MNSKQRYSPLQQNLLLNLTKLTRGDNKTQQKTQQNRNSATFLNQTLNGLNNQFIKRNYTEKNVTQGQNNNEKKQQQTVQKNRKSQSELYQQNTFTIEPWNDNLQLFSTQFKAPLTQIRQKKQKNQSLKKSFHITQVPNKIYKKNQYDLSLYETRKSSFTAKENNRMKYYQLRTEPDHEEEMKQKNYNYSSEQKVKISLDHIVQKKKHSKMSNLLKMKTHSFDKTLIKQQKIHHQSKNLIQALNKLPSDSILKKSIDRAVDVLKKRSNNYLQSSKQLSPKKRLSEASCLLDQTSKNWISCRKIDLQKTDINGANLVHNFSSSKKKDFMSAQKFQIRAQNCIAIKQKCKITFKPKRNHLIPKKNSMTENKSKYRKSKDTSQKKQIPIIKKFSFGTMLQVNHLNL